MITPSFSLTATERILPRMALDFTTASLDSRVTFTRSGNTATVTDSSGFVVPINADLPRFDYDPLTLSCKGLLIEEARTNLITYSEQFDNAVWVKANASVTANSIASPSNTVNADTLVEDTAASTHSVQQNSNVVSGTSYTFSCFAKPAGRNFIQLLIVGGFASVISAFFDLTTGAVGTTAGSPVTQAINVGNGWWRLSITATATSTATTTVQIRSSNSSTTAFYTGNGVSGIYIWGAQLEAGAFPTSYIPTVASQVTRTADVAVMTGTNFSNWYNASEGAFVASSVLTRQSTIGSTAIFSANDTTAANFINCFYRGSGALGATMTAATVSQLDQTPLGVTAANTTVNIGVAYKVLNTVSYANGTVQTTSASVAIPTLTQLQLGLSFVGVYLNGHVRNLRYWPQRILNAEGQAFSK
jgi:hypothetical protein